MSITLGSNIAALRGQRQLAKTSKELGSVLRRLSSGQRINQASDDAAALAIADALGAGSRVLNQGVRNLSDGLALLTIADAAIENLSAIVIRLEELAGQAANGVYSNEQTKALDGEAQALSDEFFRISKTTEFKGQRLLTGESPTVSLQAGAGDNAVLRTSVGGAIGTGSFNASATIATDTGSYAGSYAVTLGDVNGDGILDLITAGYASDGGGAQGQASISLGLGNGQFATAIAHITETGSSFGRSYAVALGDVNGDGVLDLITAGSVNNGGGIQGQASISLGLGNGQFRAAATIVTDTGSSFGRSYAVALGDVNGDGVLDLVTAGLANNGGGSQGQASISLGLGNGQFQAATTIATNTGSSSGTSNAVTLGDVNGDGALDLVTAGSVNNGGGIQGQASISLGLGNGQFQAATTIATDPGGSSGISLAATLEDVNGDGALDLVTAGRTNNGGNIQGQASISLGLGNGQFTTAATHATNTGSSSGSSNAVTLGDVDGDGFLDIIAAGSASNGGGVQGQASISLGLGNGQFQAAETVAIERGPGLISVSFGVSLSDVDGDGVLDLVTAGVNGAGPATFQGQASILLAQTEAGVSPLLEFSLGTLSEARQALPIFQRKREQLAQQRGEIGANQARIEVAANVLTIASENFRAAESRIGGADIAFEATSLVRLQILQQAQAAILAQANQQPKLVMSLLT